MSFPTVRERILQNLETVFKTIDGSTPFIQKVNFVSRNLKHRNDVEATELPALFITGLEDDIEHRDFQRTEGGFRVIITGYVPVLEGASASVAIEKLVHDVRVAFFIDISRGINPLKPLEHNAVTSLIDRIVQPKGTDLPLTTVEFRTIIIYRNPRGEPGG